MNAFWISAIRSFASIWCGLRPSPTALPGWAAGWMGTAPGSGPTRW